MRYWALSNTHPDVVNCYRRGSIQKEYVDEKTHENKLIHVMLGYGIGRDEVEQWDAGVCHQYFMLQDRMRKLAADGYSPPNGLRQGYYERHIMNFLCSCNSVQGDLRDIPDSELARLLRVIQAGIKLDLKPCKYYKADTGTQQR